AHRSMGRCTLLRPLASTFVPCSCQCSCYPRLLLSVPTRRSSDLREGAALARGAPQPDFAAEQPRELLADRQAQAGAAVLPAGREIGRSTRLNSSHVAISYAVFCLKNKKRGLTRRSGGSIHGRARS